MSKKMFHISIFILLILSTLSLLTYGHGCPGVTYREFIEKAELTDDLFSCNSPTKLLTVKLSNSSVVGTEYLSHIEFEVYDNSQNLEMYFNVYPRENIEGNKQVDLCINESKIPNIRATLHIKEVETVKKNNVTNSMATTKSNYRNETCKISNLLKNS